MAKDVTDRVRVEFEGGTVEKTIRRRSATRLVRLELSLDGETPAAVRVADDPGMVGSGSLYLRPDSDIRDHFYDGDLVRFESLVPAGGTAEVVYGVTGTREWVPASEPEVEGAVVLDVERTTAVPDGASPFPTPLGSRPDRGGADARTGHGGNDLASDGGLSARVTETLLGGSGDRTEASRDGTTTPTAGRGTDDDDTVGDDTAGIGWEDGDWSDLGDGDPDGERTPATDDADGGVNPLDDWIEPAAADGDDGGGSGPIHAPGERRAGDPAVDRAGQFPWADDSTGDGDANAEERADDREAGEDDLHSRIEALEADLSALQESHEAAVEELTAVRDRQRNDYEAVHAAITEVGTSVDDLRELLDDFHDELNRLQQSVEETSTECRDLRETHESDVSELSTDLESTRRAVRTLREEVEAISDVRTTLEELLGEQDTPDGDAGATTDPEEPRENGATTRSEPQP